MRIFSDVVMTIISSLFYGVFVLAAIWLIGGLTDLLYSKGLIARTVLFIILGYIIFYARYWFIRNYTERKSKLPKKKWYEVFKNWE